MSIRCMRCVCVYLSSIVLLVTSTLYLDIIYTCNERYSDRLLLYWEEVIVGGNCGTTQGLEELAMAAPMLYSVHCHSGETLSTNLHILPNQNPKGELFDVALHSTDPSIHMNHGITYSSFDFDYGSIVIGLHIRSALLEG